MGNKDVRHVHGNVLQVGVRLTLRTITMVNGQVSKSDADFIPSPDYPVTVELLKDARKTEYRAEMRDGNVAYFEDLGQLPVGMYSVAVRCCDGDGNPYRFKKRGVINVVDVTSDAGITPGVEFEASTHYLDAAVFVASGGGGGLDPANFYTKEESDSLFAEFYTEEELAQLFNKYDSTGKLRDAFAPRMILESIDHSDATNILFLGDVGETHLCVDGKIRRYGTGGLIAATYDPDKDMVYYDKKTDKFYRWTGTVMEQVYHVSGGGGGGDGTVTAVKMNGGLPIEPDEYGVVDIGTVLTQHQDISGKANSADLATVSTTGSYDDLTNKPTIPAAQVQSDWNATSGMGVILNKPTIPAAYDDTTLSGRVSALENAGYVTSSTMTTALASKQDVINDLATIRTNSGKGIANVTSQQDGSVAITLANGDTYTIVLTHTHPQYLKYVLLADEAAYNALATKDSGTLYLIPES